MNEKKMQMPTLQTSFLYLISHFGQPIYLYRRVYKCSSRKAIGKLYEQRAYYYSFHCVAFINGGAIY